LVREDHATGVGPIDHYYCQASLPTWSSGVAPCNHVRSRERRPGRVPDRDPGTYRAVPPLTSRALRPVPQPELATPRTGRAVLYRRNRWRYVGGSRNHVPPRPVRMRLCCPALAGSVSRNQLSGTEESRCPRSGRPGTDAVRCRHAARWCITSQACAALLHTNVKPNYMNTQAPKPKRPNSLLSRQHRLSGVEAGVRGGKSIRDTPKSAGHADCAPSCNAGRLTNGSRYPDRHDGEVGL